MKRFATALAFLALLIALAPHPAQAQLDPEDLTLTAPDGNPVTIDRDTFGVPHIRAGTEAALFYGQGYAVAQDRLFQIEQFRRAATGRLSEVDLGTVESDRQTRRVFYTEAERQDQLNDLSPQLRRAYDNYTAGINAYIDSALARPAKYEPLQYGLLNIPLEPLADTEPIAITQFLIRRFGGFGGEELERCEDLDSLGLSAFNDQFPFNDPSAPVTILNGSEPPGYPDDYPVTGLSQCPAGDASSVQPAEREIIIDLGGGNTIEVPSTLGSFATLINQQKSASGQVMLLGAPQLQDSLRRNSPIQNNTSTAHEVELEAPGLHIGGLGLAGIPGVILGRNEHHAWSLTSGNSDNQDTFIETTTGSDTLSQNSYVYDGDSLDFMAFEEPDLDFTFYRTVHGPVVGQDLGSQEVYTRAFTYWKEELDMAEAFNRVWRAESLSEVEDAVADIPVNFNFFYADRDQNVHYWHVGRLPDRGATGIDPRLPHLGDGSQDWAGFVPLDGSLLPPGQERADFIDFADLPQADGSDQPFFVNWNNKPVEWWDHGDTVPWIGEQRVDSLYMYVPGGTTPFSYADLKGVPDAIDDFGTYQQATRFGATLAEDREENTVPPGQSGFASQGLQLSPHYNDQFDSLRVVRESGFLGERPQDFLFKNMIFLRGLHAFASADAYRFDGFGVEVEPQSDATGLSLLVRRATDPTQGAPTTGSLPAQDSALAVTGSWTLVPTSAPPSGLTSDVCLDLDLLTAPPEDITFSGLQVYRRAGRSAPWQSVSTELRPDESDPQQICATGLSSFGEFAVGAAPGELPVELASFEAALSGDAVALSWRTFSEENNDGFVVERRREKGAAWRAVGSVESHAPGGTTTEAQTYRLTDDALPFGAEVLTYRLRQIDLGGTERVVGKQTVEVGAPLEFALKAGFPNPFREATTLRYTLAEDASVTLEVYDTLGRKVRTLVDERQPADAYTVRFDAEGLASGTYFVRLIAGDFTATRSMVLVR